MELGCIAPHDRGPKAKPLYAGEIKEFVQKNFLSVTTFGSV